MDFPAKVLNQRKRRKFEVRARVQINTNVR